MNLDKLRKLSKTELAERLVKKQEEVVNVRRELVLGKENNYKLLSKLKREIARIKTIQNEVSSSDTEV